VRDRFTTCTAISDIMPYLAMPSGQQNYRLNRKQGINTMPKLVIWDTQNKINEVAVEYGTLTIGRKADNDIQIDDPAVSAHHAKIVSFNKPSYIQDLRSTNGTYVNGNKIILEHTLEHNDVITLGKHFISYDKEAEGTGPYTQEMTQIISTEENKEILEVAAKTVHKEQG
jgi:predicted component of type VI protein secretion system